MYTCNVQEHVKAPRHCDFRVHYNLLFVFLKDIFNILKINLSYRPYASARSLECYFN